MEPGMSDPPRTATTDILRTVRAPATTLNETGQVDPSLASRERPIALEFLRLDVTYERACRVRHRRPRRIPTSVSSQMAGREPQAVNGRAGHMLQKRTKGYGWPDRRELSTQKHQI
jgi:hypothetical protein